MSDRAFAYPTFGYIHYNNSLLRRTKIFTEERTARQAARGGFAGGGAPIVCFTRLILGL
jgi:hypothetical protein